MEKIFLKAIGPILIITSIILIASFSLNDRIYADKWNGGWCPDCEWTYDFVAVDAGMKYYRCPCCFEEVRMTIFGNNEYDLERRPEACQ